MQTKTSVLVFSLAAILSLSVVTMGEIPQAIADDDDKKKKKPNFKANCEQTGNAPDDVDWDCKASFWLDKKGENLKYKIHIMNMDLTGWQTVHYDDDHNLEPESADDDVTAVHLHDAELGDGVNGPHVLNIWKAPIEDDDQMKAFPSKGLLIGNYDDSDVTPHDAGHLHGPSLTLSDKIDDLCNGDFYVMVHHGPGVLKGFVEPTSSGEKLCDKLLNGDDDDNDD